MKAYFFKTYSDKGRNRLRCLPGQLLPTGHTVDVLLNVQASRTIRSLYPLGTIFGSTTLVDSGTFYTAGDLFPMVPDDQIIQPEHTPPAGMREALDEFMGVMVTMDTGDGPPTASIVTEEKVKKTLLLKMQSNPELVPPTIKKNGFYVETDNWYLLLRNILNQVNTLLIGPTGTGKTELILMACERVGIPCSVYDMGSMYDPVAGLLGVHRLQEGGKSVFDYAKFTEDISKPGVVLLDELSRAPVTTNNILFPCLDSRRSLPVEIAGGQDLRRVEVHPDCCFVATANIGSEYTGTMSMDKALVNRFFPIELDYLSEADETQLLVTRSGIPKDVAATITKVAAEIRSINRRQELSSGVSTRETLMVAELVSDGWTPLKAMELVFLPLFEGTNAEGERGIVRKIFITR